MSRSQRQPAVHPERAGRPDPFRSRMLGFLAAVAAIWVLRASYPVTMPIAFAAVVIAAVWPVQHWLERRLPRGASLVLTVAVLLLGLVAFGAAIYFSAAEAVSGIVGQWPLLESRYQELVAWASAKGVPLSASGDRRALAAVKTIVADAYTFVAYLGLVGILVILGLPELPAAGRKLKAHLDSSARQEVIRSLELIAERIRKYLGVTLVTSLLTGVCSTLWAFATGLELALTWGVLNFLLNFVPVVGNIVGILPPTLYALIESGSPSFTLFVFVGFAVIQLVISNFVNPLLQGRSLSLSPVAVIIALSFWGWLWGIAGALIAVPLTASMAIVFDGFDRTRWISLCLSKGRTAGGDQAEAAGAP